VNVTKIILIRCQIFHLKCNKFNFWLGLRPAAQILLGSFPYTIAGFWEREGKGERERETDGLEVGDNLFHEAEGIDVPP